MSKVVRFIAAIACGCAIDTATAQLDTTNVQLDLLRAPSSPGAILLGFAESEVERPSDAVNFMVSVGQATGNATTMPSSWAVDIAPAQLAHPNTSVRQLLGITAPGVEPLSRGQRIWHNTVFSSAIRNIQGTAPDGTSAVPQAAFGAKVSLFNGRPSAATVAQFTALDNAMSAYVSSFGAGLNDSIATDALLVALKDSITAADNRMSVAYDSLDRYTALVASAGERAEQVRLIMEQWKLRIRGEELKMASYALMRDQRSAELSVSLRARYEEDAQRMLDATEAFKIMRMGFKWDVAGGVVLDFLNERMDNSQVSKGALWTTAGWETEENVAFLFLARWSLNPESAFMGEADSLERRDINNLDLGARFALDPKGGRFTLSAEAIYRQVQAELGIAPTWRVVANAAYDFGNNRRFTFSFGRNFDGTLTKDGNLVAALNLLLGFGSTLKN